MKKLEISKKDLEHNLNEIKNVINDRNVKIIAVVKANGVGLDLIKYSKFLIQNGIKYLAVACTNEAIKLRQSGIKEEILMMSPISNKTELKELVENDIIVTIDSYEQIETIEEISDELGKNANAHIKIDTGFGRYGFLYTEKEIILETLKRANKVKICGIFTHFSSPRDEKYTRLQFNRFLDIIKFLEKNNYYIETKHCSESTAFLKYPDMMLDAVRLRFCNSRKNIV